MFAAEIRKRRVQSHSYSRWRWYMGEVFVRINGETYYLWRAVDHEGEVLEVIATKRRDRKAALAFLKRAMKRYGRPEAIVTNRLRSYRAAMKVIGISDRQECGRWFNNRAENSHQPFRRREGAMAKVRDIKTLTFAIACSLRLNGWCEFSALLLSQRPRSCRSTVPVAFITAAGCVRLNWLESPGQVS